MSAQHHRLLLHRQSVYRRCSVHTDDVHTVHTAGDERVKTDYRREGRKGENMMRPIDGAKVVRFVSPSHTDS